MRILKKVLFRLGSHGRGRSGGFTLIELMVVVAIIGVLATVGIQKLGPAIDKAKMTRAKAEVRILYQAIVAYHIDTDKWPGVGFANTNLITLADWNSAWKIGYISSGIGNDPWGTPYLYDGDPDTECGQGSTAICSAGPNGLFESWNIPGNVTPQADDICRFFESQC